VNKIAFLTSSDKIAHVIIVQTCLLQKGGKFAIVETKKATGDNPKRINDDRF